MFCFLNKKCENIATRKQRGRISRRKMLFAALLPVWGLWDWWRWLWERRKSRGTKATWHSLTVWLPNKFSYVEELDKRRVWCAHKRLNSKCIWRRVVSARHSLRGLQQSFGTQVKKTNKQKSSRKHCCSKKINVWRTIVQLCVFSVFSSVSIVPKMGALWWRLFICQVCLMDERVNVAVNYSVKSQWTKFCLNWWKWGKLLKMLGCLN